jgi:hypothetical protein
MVGMDTTIVNVALPSIGRDLHASVSGLQWTIDGYTLVLASLLMLSGATADRAGRRRVFQIGLALFTRLRLLARLRAGDADGPALEAESTSGSRTTWAGWPRPDRSARTSPGHAPVPVRKNHF